MGGPLPSEDEWSRWSQTLIAPTWRRNRRPHKRQGVRRWQGGGPGSQRWSIRAMSRQLQPACEVASILSWSSPTITAPLPDG